jgi:phosphoglucosamine mutase
MGRLFGTDGVRGKAGEYPLDVGTVRRLGAALTRALRHGDAPVSFLAGRDTRESGGWIERELAFGIGTQGGALTSAGVIPTPAVAYLTPRMGFTAGVVISASHNPFEDNGIKVFSGAGEKFTETLEQRVEAIVSDETWTIPSGDAGPVEQSDPRAAYIGHLLEILPPSLRSTNLRVVIDCANGATTTVAPRVFKELGLDILRTDGTSTSAAVRPRRSCSPTQSSPVGTTSESRMTATATGRFSWMLRAVSSTATP